MACGNNCGKNSRSRRTCGLGLEGAARIGGVRGRLLMSGDGVGDDPLDDRTDTNTEELADEHADQGAKDHDFARVVGGDARNDGDGECAKPAASPDDFGEYSGRHRKAPNSDSDRDSGREVGVTAHGLEAAPSQSAGE